MGHWCCVVGCHAKSHGRDGRKVDYSVRFFRFPTWKRGYGAQIEEITKRRREAWVAAVRRKDLTFYSISPFMRVCSRHFHKGQPAYEMMETDPDWAPSLHMGHSFVTLTNTARSERPIIKQEQLQEETPEMGVHQDADIGEVQIKKEEPDEEQRSEEGMLAAGDEGDRLKTEDETHEAGDEGDWLKTEDETHEAGDEGDWLKTEDETHEAGDEGDRLKTEDETHNIGQDVTRTECDLCVFRRAEVNRLLEENRKLRRELDQCRMSDGFFGEDDEKVKYYTGLPNLGTFMSLFHFLTPLMSDQKKILTPCQMLLLTLIRLRLDLPVQHLAHLFRVSPKTVYRTFNDMVSFLYTNLSHAIMGPDRDTLLKAMSQQFVDAFGQKVTVIIDCFEISTEKPSDLETRAQMFSSCKHSHTMKYLIGITPRGAISFLSKGWGGRTSDKHVLLNSDLLDCLLPGDIVLADRGFGIQERAGMLCAEVKLPELTGGRCQLAAGSVEETREMAHLRSHVKMVMGNVCQKYRMLTGTIPVSMILPCEGEEATMLDKVVSVCCVLTNHCPATV
ncbi:uncharacterized protein LOC115385843 [Salarias fasciatus]|uniref:uncharacterized protein LOC115385843 n=1 Tax=Salarias fasciatus TaxID=181472 RepID=UPI001176C9C1|nr:uncharacterized protein LOC115385843 [Salarias fasciatus]